MTATLRTCQSPRAPVEPEGIDDCIVMYADEQLCECIEEEVLNVTTSERGQPVCNNCGRRRV